MKTKHDKLEVESDGSLALRGVVVINCYPPELTADDTREIARRFNAEPELRAENQRLRDAMEAVKLAADMNGNTYLMRVATVALEAGK